MKHGVSELLWEIRGFRFHQKGQTLELEAQRLGVFVGTSVFRFHHKKKVRH